LRIFLFEQGEYLFYNSRVLNVIERKFYSFRDTPQKAALRAQKAELKRINGMRGELADKSVSAVIDFRNEIENMPWISGKSFAASEQEFIEKLGGVEVRVAEKFKATTQERAQNSRLSARQVAESINFAISHPNPVRAELVPSLRRVKRAAVAWGLRFSEDLTGEEIDYNWSVNFLSKVLTNSVGSEDWNTYINNPPRVLRQEKQS
jgi:hypothetical protein